MGLNSVGGSGGAGLIQAWEAVFSQCSVVRLSILTWRLKCSKKSKAEASTPLKV